MALMATMQSTSVMVQIKNDSSDGSLSHTRSWFCMHPPDKSHKVYHCCTSARHFVTPGSSSSWWRGLSQSHICPHWCLLCLVVVLLDRLRRSQNRNILIIQIGGNKANMCLRSDGATIPYVLFTVWCRCNTMMLTRAHHRTLNRFSPSQLWIIQSNQDTSIDVLDNWCTNWCS